MILIQQQKTPKTCFRGFLFKSKFEIQKLKFKSENALSFHHLLIQSFTHSIIQSFSHSVIQSFTHSVLQKTFLLKFNFQVGFKIIAHYFCKCLSKSRSSFGIAYTFVVTFYLPSKYIRILSGSVTTSIITAIEIFILF